MNVANIYAAGFALMGVFGVFTARKSFKAAPVWSARRRGIFSVAVLFVGGSWLCAAGFYWGWFHAWMTLPLGASFLGMLPLPCYFAAVDRIVWLRVLRNIYFVAVALFCFAIAFRLFPLAWLGL